MTVKECKECLQKEIGKIFVGKKRQIELILMSVFAGGHVLLDDLPGSGKTTLIRTMSLALGCDFKRMQFTPDLLPSDIVGMTIFDRKAQDFRLVKGPVHTNIFLADEINRAIPRTQAALLEAMEERQVTIDGTSLPLPRPFLVLATQNPVEMESTFRLPAAQMDRFFLRLSLGYPDAREEKEILTQLGMGTPFDMIQPVVTPELLCGLRDEIERVHVSEDMKEYIVSLVGATREHPDIALGGSPRASRSLYQGAKTYAAMQGRDYVVPEDIQQIWQPVMGHRIMLKNEAAYKKKQNEDILNDILEDMIVPPKKEELFYGDKTEQRK